MVWSFKPTYKPMQSTNSNKLSAMGSAHLSQVTHPQDSKHPKKSGGKRGFRADPPRAQKRKRETTGREPCFVFFLGKKTPRCPAWTSSRVLHAKVPRQLHRFLQLARRPCGIALGHEHLQNSGAQNIGSTTGSTVYKFYSIHICPCGLRSE